MVPFEATIEAGRNDPGIPLSYFHLSIKEAQVSRLGYVTHPTSNEFQWTKHSTLDGPIRVRGCERTKKAIKIKPSPEGWFSWRTLERNHLAFNSNDLIVISAYAYCHERLCTYGDPHSSKVRRERHPERAKDKIRPIFSLLRRGNGTLIPVSVRQNAGREILRKKKS